MHDVILVFKHYLVALYSVLWEKQQPLPRPIGSGTLVEIQGSYYILTAAHVWHKAREAEKIGLGLVLTEYQSSFMVLRDGISSKELWLGKISEWGPDLALLRLATADIATIKAHKSFLNLVQQKASFYEYPPRIESAVLSIRTAAHV